MKKFAAAVAGIMALGVVGSALAEDKYDEAIEYRKAAFTMVKWHFGPMGAMAKGKIPFDAKAFAYHAEALAVLSKMPLEGFIEGSDMGETKAKPEVWSKRTDFEAKMQAFEKAAGELAVVAKSGDEGAIKAQFGETGKTCKSCHDDFKNK